MFQNCQSTVLVFKLYKYTSKVYFCLVTRKKCNIFLTRGNQGVISRKFCDKKITYW